MTQLQTEMHQLKNDILEMFRMVSIQMIKAEQSLTKFDPDLAHEVVAKEKRVNAYELKLDRDCEDIFALYNPMAVDLRFVLAVLKINTNLERLGDIADGIARLVIDQNEPYSKELLERSQVLIMFDSLKIMLSDAAEAFENEDSRLARSIFKRDETLNEINNDANHIISGLVKSYPDSLFQCLNLISMIRKLERAGDQVKNIAEEIIFYIEAKVLKHKPGKRNEG